LLALPLRAPEPQLFSVYQINAADAPPHTNTPPARVPSLHP
jgi:hypothetical protein